jgi:hypothetical protein
VEFEMEQRIAQEDCWKCYGEGGRWDAESQDQWYWCDLCDASSRHFGKKVEGVLVMASLERQCQAFESAIVSFSKKAAREALERKGDSVGDYNKGVAFGLDLALAMLLDSMDAEKEKMDKEDSDG